MTGLPRVFNILLAVAIASVLAAILASIIGKAGRRAQQHGCVTNLHQLSLAMQMYAGDNDDTLPPYPMHNQDAWPQVLRHYALSAKDERNNSHLVEVATFKPYFCPSRAEKGYGYAMNFYLAGSLIDTSGDSSKIILLAEASEATDEVWWVNDSETTWGYSRYQPPIQHLPLSSVHPRGGNVAHLDGSIEAVNRSQLPIENWLPY